MARRSYQVKQLTDNRSNPEMDLDYFWLVLFAVIMMAIHAVAFGRRRGFRRSRRPRLGANKNPDGYVLTANGRLEHREIAEQILGRKLQRSEDIHHMNGIRHDNRPENLCVMDHQDHMRFHEWYDSVRSQGKYPTQETQLRKLCEELNGTVLKDVVIKKAG